MRATSVYARCTRSVCFVSCILNIAVKDSNVRQSYIQQPLCMHCRVIKLNRGMVMGYAVVACHTLPPLPPRRRGCRRFTLLNIQRRPCASRPSSTHGITVCTVGPHHRIRAPSATLFAICCVCYGVIPLTSASEKTITTATTTTRTTTTMFVNETDICGINERVILRVLAYNGRLFSTI